MSQDEEKLMATGAMAITGGIPLESRVIPGQSKTGRKYCVSWQMVNEAVDILTFTLEKLNPHTVIGIGRGGLIPAVMISHKMGINMKTIDAKAYEGTRRTLQKPITITGWQPEYNDERVVIIDDILDSGDTCRALRALVGIGNERYKFATLFTKAVVDGIYFGRVSPEVWVQFPWEN